MIYTVTLNPAIDYAVYLPTLQPGKIQRATRETAFFGGKGINVSIILAELGIASVATGFTAGFTGEALEKGIASDLVKSDFVRVAEGLTRINVKIRSGIETDINGHGPVVSGEEIERLYQKLDALKKGDVLVLAGSIPGQLPSNMYETLMSRLSGRGVRVVVDAEKELLLRSMTYCPFLVKPNIDELSTLFGVRIETHGDALKYATLLQEMGAANVLVSMGEDGALLLDASGNHHYRPACGGRAVDTVGAGDAMVAGFLAGYLEKEDYEYALKLGTAAGSATAFCKGLATRENILGLM